MACSTGGMLSTTHDFIKRMNPDANIRLFGQENNPESYAICLVDMLIKGQKADNIRFADTMKKDCFEKVPMRFVIANPPFGLSWGGKDESQKWSRRHQIQRLSVVFWQHHKRRKSNQAIYAGERFD